MASKFESGCRCCLATDSILTDSSSEDGATEITLHIDRLKQCFPDIKVAENRNHTDGAFFICNNCLISLTEAHRFKETVRRVNAMFHDYFNGEGQPPYGGEGETYLESVIKIEPEVKLEPRSDNDDDDNDRVVATPPPPPVSPDVVVKKKKKKSKWKPKTKKFKCEHCQKAFVSNCHLAEHRRVHSSEKAFVCESCNKAFRFKKLLMRHMKSHTGVKPYSCDLCDKSFAHLDHLTVHKRTHTDYRPYNCAHCDKTFTKKFDLKRHSRIHSGEKPYKCSACGKCFTLKNTLRKHVRVLADGDGEIKCCGMEKPKEAS